MIRETNSKITISSNGTVLRISDLFGTSSDTKPSSGYANGSTFTEVDTGDIYLFDESAGEWVQTIALQG